MKTLIIGGILSGILLLSSCGNETTKVKKGFDNTGKPLSVTVTTYKTLDQLNANVKEPALGLKGQAHLLGEVCDIKLYEPRTLREDDEFALTLGHELMHCLYGNYHK